eukprot:XP_001697238.1 predicted protein [Chlamydomonas reinhardtii]
MSSTQEQKGPIRRWPSGFWTAFNCWWHAEYQRIKARPTSKSISRWHGEHSNRVWGDAAVGLAETQRHANRMKPRRSAAAVAFLRHDSFDGEDIDDELGPGAAVDTPGGDALHAADPAEDVGDALDGDQKAAAAAVTAEELNTSCLPALHAGDTSTPHAAANGTGAVSAMGQWDSSYSLNTINQQPPCTSASQPYGATCGVPVFPADARAHRGQTATGLKRGFHESGCGGVETASGPARQRMRCNSSNNPLAGAELVGAASSSNTGSAASAAWMRRADRELDELMRDMGMLLQQQRQKPLAAPQQAPVNWQLLQQVQPQLAMRCATGGWPLQRGASVGGYEIEAIDSVPLEALL